MRLFGYIKEVVALWMKQNGYDIKLTPNSGTTYTAARTAQIAPGNADSVLVSEDGTQTLTNKSLDSDNNTLTNIVNANIKSTAAIARSKIATGTADYVVINAASTGAVSEEQYLAKARGGAGASMASVTFPSTGTITTDAGVSTFTNKTFDADGTGNSISNIENADIKAGAAIAVNKLAALTASKAVVSDGSGFLSSVAGVTATQIGYLSGLGGTLTTGGAWTQTGAHTLGITTTNNTAITLPTSGTLAIQSGESFDDIVTLKLRDATTAAYTLQVIADSSATAMDADHTFTVDVNNGDRALDLSENLTVANGYDITLTAEDAAGSVTLDNCTFEAENTDATQRAIKITSAKAGNTTLTLQENLTVGDGYDVSITAEDAAATITLDNCGLEVEDTAGVGHKVKLINADAAADTSITLNEDLTIGGGSDVTITAEDAATAIVMDNSNFEVERAGVTQRDLKLSIGTDANAGLSIEGTSGAINQDVTSDASPTFANPTATGEIRMLESAAGTDNYTGFKAPADLGAANIIYTMPSADGGATNVLTTDGAKTLSWAAAASAALNAQFTDIGNASNVRTATDTTKLGSIVGSTKSATVTFDEAGGAADDMCSLVGHGFTLNDTVYFSGADLPSNIVAGTVYYVIPTHADYFQLMTSPGTGAAAELFQIGDDGSGALTVYHGGLWPKHTQDYTVSVSDDYTISDTDRINTILCANAGAAKTITLPTTADNKHRQITIKKTGSDAYAYTVKGEAAGETIDGVSGTTGFKIPMQYEGIKIVSDGSVWHILEHFGAINQSTLFSVTSSALANVTWLGYYRRERNIMHATIWGDFTGVTTNANMTFTIPNSLTIDRAKLASADSSTIIVGESNLYDSGNAYFNGRVIYGTTTTVAVAFFDDNGARENYTLANLGNTTPFNSANGDKASLYFSVPILEWLN